MAYEYILYEKKDRVAYVTLNRPDVMNALHPPANRELCQAFDEFDQDPECWIAVITGAGERAFCAGNDLKYQARVGAEVWKKEKEKVGKGGFGGITARFDCYKPIIAAVNGFALGGGFEIVLASDIVIAAEHASFGLPEPTVGLIPGAGGVHRLPRQIPFKLAMGMMMTGKRITAQEARELGLVNEVVPMKELMPTVEKWIASIFACAPLAIRAIKQCVLQGTGYPLEEAFLRKSYSLQNLLPTTEDFAEGPRAFAEKRKPQWKGK
jgi:enoyl-CoA hydratase/carnithine racemase